MKSDFKFEDASINNGIYLILIFEKVKWVV